MNHIQPHSRQRQQGVAALVVLVLLTVMLLGSLTFARVTEVGTLASGNVAFKERALQASTIGINTAFAAINTMPSSQQNIGGWYFASARPLTAEGLPQGIDWAVAATTPMDGAYQASYVVERMCVIANVTNPQRECLYKQAQVEASGKVPPDGGGLDPPTGEQFRVTVRVTGPRNTLTFAQVLTTRPS
jgi:type IV pilus assembly protein PilX